MRKIMIRNSLLMLLVTAVFAGALTLYLRSASNLTSGEATVSGGSYTASAVGFCSDVSVTATFADGVLTGLSIDASGETEAIGGAAATELTTAMLAAGGTSGVDAVAGATITSDAVFAAYADCAAQAGVVSGESYTASAEGFCSDVVVTATFADGALVALSADASGETPEIGGVAAEAVVDAILAAGSADGVDAVASATLTSDAVLAAFADCAAQAGGEAVEEEIVITAIEDLAVTAGADAYSASAPGYAGDVSVTLAYAEDGTIVSVSVDASAETAEIGGAAANDLAASIATAGSAYSVDAVAGATITSNAVLAAARYAETAVLLSQSILYQASAAGYSSDVVVTAGYSEDGVLIYLSVDSSGETAKVGGTTADALAAEILAAGNADGVDIDLYAGSTITADAVLDAFAECAGMVGSASNLVTVNASAAGYSSDVVVTATYANGTLAALSVDASGETPKVGGTTADELIAEILAAGNADGVDIDLYAGSTITADAVLDAFADCAAQAG